MLQTLKNAWKVNDIRRKMIFTIIVVVLYRLGCAIPVPYVNAAALSADIKSAGESNLLGYFNLLSGDSFSKGTLFALSISPYITASIVMQLLTIAIPALERMSKDGPEGQKKITQITRYVTVALALITAFGYYLTIKRQGDLVEGAGVFEAIVIISAYCAGAALIMWLGEKINDHGIGNGISIILFANIVSRGPDLFLYWIEFFKAGQYVSFAAVLIIMLAIITFIVWFTDAERRLGVQYAKRQVGRKMYGGMNTHLPIKLNMSGVMPIIFAQSIVALPATIGMIVGADTTQGFFKYFSMTSYVGAFLNFALIIAFAYFYLAISFNTVEVANNLKKNGGTIIGIRPGKPTADYIKKVVNRVTLIGALFLGFVSIFPQVANWLSSNRLGGLVFGGSSLLIIIGVALETVRDLESQVSMRNYKGFLE